MLARPAIPWIVAIATSGPVAERGVLSSIAQTVIPADSSKLSPGFSGPIQESSTHKLLSNRYEFDNKNWGVSPQVSKSIGRSKPSIQIISPP